MTLDLRKLAHELAWATIPGISAAEREHHILEGLRETVQACADKMCSECELGTPFVFLDGERFHKVALQNSDYMTECNAARILALLPAEAPTEDGETR